MSAPVSFIEVLSGMNHWRPMLELLQSLSENPKSVSDADITQVWDSYRGSVQSNCESTAEAFMAGFASICSRRPPLMQKMLTEALEPLFMLGYENADDIISWAGVFIRKLEPYMGRPDDVAVEWIRASFCNSREEIDVALHAFWRSCETG